MSHSRRQFHEGLLQLKQSVQSITSCRYRTLSILFEQCL